MNWRPIGALVVALVLSACRSADGAGSVSMAPVDAGPSPAAAALAGLPVGAAAPMTGYRRAAFGQSWSDDVTVAGGHNGCDTRNDVLRRDLVDLVVKPGTQGCVALTGTLADPYTGQTLMFRRGAASDAVQIDHVVALAAAWRTGAQLMGADLRQDLANDPLELLAVDGPTNQDKGDGDAAGWLPPNRAEQCAYVARQVAVKMRYRLWVTPPERNAMATVLALCPTIALPTTATTAVPPISRSP